MQSTQHYNFPLYEGEDTPNLLVEWNATMQALDTKLYALSIGNAGHEIIREIEQLITAVNGLIDEVTQAISDINDLQQTVNGVQSTVNSLFNNIDEIQDSIVALQGVVTTVQQLIASVQEDVSELQDDVSDNTSDISSLQSSVNTLTSSVSTLNGALENMQTSISGIDTRVTALEQEPSYELPTASANTLGGIKVGDNLSIDANGVLSASGGGGGDTLPDGVIVNLNYFRNKYNLDRIGCLPTPFEAHVGLLIDMYSDFIVVEYALNKVWDYSNNMWVDDRTIPFNNSYPLNTLNVMNTATYQYDEVPFNVANIGDKALVTNVHVTSSSNNVINIPSIFVPNSIPVNKIKSELYLASSPTSIQRGELDFELIGAIGPNSITLKPIFSVSDDKVFYNSSVDGLIDVTNKPNISPKNYTSGIIVFYSTAGSISSYTPPTIGNLDDLPARAQSCGAVASYFGYLTCQYSINFSIGEGQV